MSRAVFKRLPRACAVVGAGPLADLAGLGIEFILQVSYGGPEPTDATEEAQKTGLEAARRAWRDAPDGAKNDTLLMGFPLAQAQSWLAQRVEDLPPADREFVAPAAVSVPPVAPVIGLSLCHDAVMFPTR
jgi:hypothetical protein